MDNWIEVEIDTTSEGMEPLGGLLEQIGITSFLLEDEKDFFTFLEQNKQYWDYVDEALLESRRGISRVRLYLPDDENGSKQLETLKRALVTLPERVPTVDFGTLQLSCRQTKNEDWENNWKAYYQPFAVGERLYIVPEWEQEADVPPGRISIVLNPGLSFGTGSHASTQLCLTALEQAIKPGDRVLDLGCGSGILSIAALKLGACFAAGCDIDPKAVDVARENALLNEIEREQLYLRTGNILSNVNLFAEIKKEKFQVILANIVADVIIALAPMVGDFLAPGGVLICSGIIDDRAEEVGHALEKQGFTLQSVRQKDGWVSYTAAVI